MRNWATLGLLALTLVSTGAEAAAVAYPTPPTARRDRRETAPATLIGVWKADLTASKYSLKPPKHYVRSFEYTRDAMIQVAFMIQYMDGSDTAGHWAARLDGSPSLEYRREWGSTPFAEPSLKMVDPYTFLMGASRPGYSQAMFKLSQDGTTLTQHFSVAQGAPEQYLIYHRWVNRQ